MAKKAPAKAPKGKAKDMLLVASKVKTALRAHNVNVASDAATALNDVVYTAIEQAVKRAKANSRKTVRPYDFWA